MERSGRSVHSKILSTLRENLQPQIKTSVQILETAIQARGGNAKYLITSRMIRTVYVETKLNIALMQHSKVVELQKLNSADMGYHHRDKRAAKRMLETISKYMHLQLVTHLCSEESGHLSLIVDSTTDVRGNHYMITYIRAMEYDRDPENGNLLLVRPVVYFYKMIYLDFFEDSDALLRSITDAVRYDSISVPDFEKKFKAKLIAFSSDGASVMQGKHNGLSRKLEQYVNRSLVSVHCMAHRLQLSAGHAFEEVPLFNKLEELISAKYNFYNNKGHKRKGHLRQTSEALSST